MKVILIVLLLACGKKNSSGQLPPQWVEGATEENVTVEQEFNDILSVQGKVLQEMDDRALPMNFKMTEMITDIAVSKKGLLGLAALKANNGVEIKWKKNSPAKKAEEDDSVDLTVEEDQSVSDLSETVFEMVKASGKVKLTPQLKKSIEGHLRTVQDIMQKVHMTESQNWKLGGLRFDLNFSAGGKVWFFSSLGGNFRIRMEWKIINKPPSAGPTSETKFVSKALLALDQVVAANQKFIPKKVSIGVGTTYKKELAIWKYSAGFIGFLVFVPKPPAPVTIPQILNDEIILAGFTQKSGELRISVKDLAKGLQKSLQTASFFIQRIEELPTNDWYISDVKTVNDISYTGFFGLADFTTKGAVEIDFKRK